MGNSKSYFGSKRNITLGLFGLDNAGKSSILENLANEEVDENPLPTMGYSSRRFSKGRYNILLMDLGGGPDIRGIWPKYFAETHGIIYVVDTSDVDRMTECKEELLKLLKDNRMTCKPLLILCNKSDKQESIGLLEVMEKLDLRKILRETANVSDDFVQPKTRMWLCTALKSKTHNRQDRRLKKAFKWLLHSVTREWETLSSRVQAQHGVEMEQKERERRERMERRRQKREEEERLEAEAIQALEDTGQDIGPSPKSNESQNTIRVTADIERHIENEQYENISTAKTVNDISDTDQETMATERTFIINTTSNEMPSDGSLNSLSDNTTTDTNTRSKQLNLVTVESKTVDQAIGGSVPPGTNSFNVITVNFPPSLLKHYSPPPSSPSPSEKKDSGISVQKDNALMDRTLEKKDAVATVSGSQEMVSEPVSKRKTKPAKIISKIRNRNKTFPASGDIQESNLTNKPPLVSSWVSHDTVLPEDHDTEDFIQQERKEMDKVHDDDDTLRDRARQLPPLITTNHPTEKSFHLPEDVLVPVL